MEERAQRIERRLELPLLVAALLTIPAIAIEQSSVGEPWDTLALVVNWIIWLAFVAEVAVMLTVVPDRWKWLRSHQLEVALVIVTPPFLPAALQGARAFRVLRLLRIATAAMLLRRMLSTEGVRDAAVLALVTVLGGGAAYAAVEKSSDGQALSAWDGVWWAITTVTTVGYGDSYPTTTPGRIIAVVVMLVGIGFVAILTAAAAARFTRERRAEEADIEQHLAEIIRRLDAIERRG